MGRGGGTPWAERRGGGVGAERRGGTPGGGGLKNKNGRENTP